MVELGELEKNHEEFEKRGVKVFAISVDDLEGANKTRDTLNLQGIRLVSDQEKNIAKAVSLIHEGAGLAGEDVNAPTTMILDGKGVIRWVHRPSHVIERPGSAVILEKIDEVL